MAGLLKPSGATKLVGALRAEFPDLPIHVHTHDTAGLGAASMIACYEAGADAVDLATDSMSGTTSQPSLGAVVHALHGTDLDTGLDPTHLAAIDDYWTQARAVYAPFESGQKSGSSEVYTHEMPGGQYTNLMFQAGQLGLSEQWPKVKQRYAEANLALGDIIKVTPSSKVAGDLAQFMVTNDIKDKDELVSKLEASGGTMSLPQSVVEYFQGWLGIPHGGFPEKLRSLVLEGRPLLENGKTCFEGRPGAEMPEYDFDKGRDEIAAQLDYNRAQILNIRDVDVLSHALYVLYLFYIECMTEYSNILIILY